MPIPIYPILKVTFAHYGIMEGLFRKGWTSNAVQSFMTQNVTGYRRSTVQAVRRKVLDVLKFESYFKAIALNTRPSIARIPDLQWNRHEKYKIMFNFEVVDKETGQIKSYRGSHYDNEYLTKGEYVQKIQNELEPTNYVDKGQTLTVSVTQVTHKKGFSY